MSQLRSILVLIAVTAAMVAIRLILRDESGIPAPPGAAAAAASPRTRTPTPAIAAPVDDGRRLDLRQVRSELLHRDVPVNILLPPNYEQDSSGRYPVLYLLHGYGGNERAWNRQAISAALGWRQWIVVMPAAGISFYMNTPRQGRYQSFFGQELVPHIDARYRTIARQEGRAIAGLSMGGYGAWRLALAEPGVFGSACSMSGVLRWGEAEEWWAWGFSEQNARALYGDDEARDRYPQGRLWPLIESNRSSDGKWTGPSLYAFMGTSDMLLQSSRQMHKQLKEASIPCAYEEFPGGHNGAFWNEHLDDVVAFHAKYLAEAQ